MPSEDARSLENLLDAAGRDVQPTHPGWQTLTHRLAQIKQERPGPRRLWWLAPPLALAAAAAALFLALWLGDFGSQGGRVLADTLPIEVKRKDVELTILSVAETEGETLYMPLVQKLGNVLAGSPTLAAYEAAGSPSVATRGRPAPGRKLTGQALVKDHRLILHLQEGDNVVRFTDVAATIDPTSVRFVSHTDAEGTQVVEQNFEYDLVNADALLKRYLDKEVVCV